LEIDGKGLEVDDIKQADRTLYFRGCGPTHCRVIIINEVHALTPGCLKLLLTLLERPQCPIPSHAAWIFTTIDDEGKLFADADGKAFLSRCEELCLTSQGLAKAFAKWLKQVAQIEGLDGQADAAYLRLVNDCDGNLRRAFQRIEKGAMLLPEKGPTDAT
jgi:DNA polymerase III gamma/tau subunit